MNWANRGFLKEKNKKYISDSLSWISCRWSLITKPNKFWHKTGCWPLYSDYMKSNSPWNAPDISVPTNSRNIESKTFIEDQLSDKKQIPSKFFLKDNTETTQENHICKWRENTTFIASNSMLSGFEEKAISVQLLKTVRTTLNLPTSYLPCIPLYLPYHQNQLHV